MNLADYQDPIFYKDDNGKIYIEEFKNALEKEIDKWIIIDAEIIIEGENKNE